MTSFEDPWAVRAEAFPRGGEPGEKLRFLLNYAVLAPSGHNTQPWVFRLDGDAVELIADRTRALPVVDPHDRELTISLGCALANLEIAAARFGLELQVEHCEGPGDRVAWAKLGGTAHQPDEEEIALFQAIPKRRTNRSAYFRRALPDALVARCGAWAEAFGVAWTAARSGDTRRAVAGLVAEGDRRQFDDPSFRRELAAWMHPSRSHRRDGLSGAGFGMPDLLTPLGAMVVRTFDLGEGVAARDAEKIESCSPLLALLSTPEDTPAHWLAAGRALERILLLLTARGFAASYMNQPVEVPDLRPKLAEAMAAPGTPQILLRCGEGPEVGASPRRPLPEVLQQEI